MSARPWILRGKSNPPPRWLHAPPGVVDSGTGQPVYLVVRWSGFDPGWIRAGLTHNHEADTNVPLRFFTPHHQSLGGCPIPRSGTRRVFHDHHLIMARCETLPFLLPQPMASFTHR